MSLGRGLESLIPDNNSKTIRNNKDSLVSIRLEEIKPNLNQPRRKFDEEGLQELADSIKKNGVIEPILVYKDKDDYILIAGERRWRAAQLAGLEEIPAIIKSVDNNESLRYALIENIQREDLNVIELAQGYQKLIELFNYTHDELASLLGKNRSSLTNVLRILNLPKEIQEMILKGSISYGAARALLTLKNVEDQITIAHEIQDKDMSVREVERLIKKYNKPQKSKKKEEDPFTLDLEERLSKRMDASVRITNRHNNKGKIEIRYSSLDHLNSILETMGIQQESV